MLRSLTLEPTRIGSAEGRCRSALNEGRGGINASGDPTGCVKVGNGIGGAEVKNSGMGTVGDFQNHRGSRVDGNRAEV